MIYKNYDQLINKVQKDSKKKTVVLVAAGDRHALEAVCQASKENIVNPILVGGKKKISEILREIGENPSEYHIVGIEEESDMVKAAVELINNGDADFLMKGKIDTASLLKGVINKESNLHTGGIMSHVAFFEVPGYHKLLVMTDGGMIISPTLEQKVQIVKNVVNTLANMGYLKPKIAVLAAVETVNPSMPETLDAAALKRMNQEGILTNCVLEGPLSYDVAMNKESAQIKGYESENCGDFDVLLVPNLTAGNILAKSLIYTAGAKMAGFIVGAKIPIVLTSRGATTAEKYLSLVLSAQAV